MHSDSGSPRSETSREITHEDTLVQTVQGKPRQLGRRSFLRGAAVAMATAPAVALVAGPGEIVAREPNDGSTYVSDFKDIQRHENAHVAFLVKTLGAKARPKPSFKDLVQNNFRAFATTSQALENTGVGAYLGAVPAIFDKTVLSGAGSIALIEARHAGFLNKLMGVPVTQNVFKQEQSFERALTIAEVVAQASPFISSLNGGPPLTFSTTPSAANDIDILNFALALEYLEAEYYNLNAPKFYK